MRVLDCECGQTVQAANDDELRVELAAHLREQHPAESRQQLGDDELQSLIQERAYDATDS
jgi:predicted small metal-binding protein